MWILCFAFAFRLLKVTKSVNGKNLTMFSFEGDFRTRPSVSLGGASKKVKTKTFIRLMLSILCNNLILLVWISALFVCTSTLRGFVSFQEEKASLLHRTQEERKKREVFFKCPCVCRLLTFLSQSWVCGLISYNFKIFSGRTKTTEKCYYHSVFHKRLPGLKTRGKTL